MSSAFGPLSSAETSGGPCCWPVMLTLPDDEMLTVRFCCTIAPLSPGLLIRIEMTVFWGWFCTEEAFESAVWLVDASWFPPCWPVPAPVPALWPVAEPLELPAAPTDALICVIGPSFPGLLIRIEMTMFWGCC